jgi:hypothetical protein
VSKEIKLNDMTTKLAIKNMMEGSPYKQFKEIANELKKEKSTFQSWLDNDSLRVRDLKVIADLMGYEVTLKQKQN